MVSFQSKLINLKSTVWSSGIIVPLDIASAFLNQNDKRVICHFGKNIKLHAALLPKGDNTWFININKELQKRLSLSLEEVIKLDIETDESKYGMEAPEEFLELLEQDKIGKNFFENLTMGKRRALLQIVLKYKSSQKRIDKSIVILDYLVSVNGNLDFKEVHEAIKRSNQL